MATEPAEPEPINLPPQTTAAQDLVAAGQRSINFVWEAIQAAIALMVSGTTVYVCAKLSLLAMLPEITDKQAAISTMGFMLLSNIIGLIIGFYFGRVNHQRVGGVGPIPPGQTRGTP